MRAALADAAASLRSVEMSLSLAELSAKDTLPLLRDDDGVRWPAPLVGVLIMLPTGGARLGGGTPTIQYSQLLLRTTPTYTALPLNRATSIANRAERADARARQKPHTS